MMQTHVKGRFQVAFTNHIAWIIGKSFVVASAIMGDILNEAIQDIGCLGHICCGSFLILHLESQYDRNGISEVGHEAPPHMMPHSYMILSSCQLAVFHSIASICVSLML